MVAIWKRVFQICNRGGVYGVKFRIILQGDTPVVLIAAIREIVWFLAYYSKTVRFSGRVKGMGFSVFL